MRKVILLLSGLALFSCQKENTLEVQVNKVLEGKNVTVGVYAVNPANGKSFGINDEKLFPLQSVFKFHVAAKVLSEVDAGSLKLNDRIPIKASQLLDNTWSPLRDEHGKKDMTMQLDSIMYYMVSQSDNNACDILIDLVGGPSSVQSYFDSLGIKNLQIQLNEEQMQSAWNEQFKNVSTPKSVTNTLHEFYLRRFLSGDSHNFLYGLMSSSTTGKNRIKAGVPAGTKVAHKTGTSGRSETGISAATNDMGFVVLPNGKTLILTIFVSNSSETDDVNEKVIADITKTLVASTHFD